MDNKPTVAELIDELKIYKPNDQIIFGRGDLTFFTTKDRTGVVQILFNEQYSITPP